MIIVALIYFIFGIVIANVIHYWKEAEITVGFFVLSFLLGGILWPIFLWEEVLQSIWDKIKDKRII